MKGGGSREPLPFLCRSSFLPLFFPIPSEKPIAFWRWAFPFPAGESPWTMRYGVLRSNNILWAPRPVAIARSAYGIRRAAPAGNTSLTGRQVSAHHWAHPVRDC